jgi:hypothetical protein
MPNIDMLPLVRIISLLIMLAGGVVCGFVFPIRLFGHVPGFTVGAAFGGVFALLGSLMAGEMVAGWMEGILGTNFGVPCGMFVGCFIGAFVLVSIAGGIGTVISQYGGDGQV